MIALLTTCLSFAILVRALNHISKSARENCVLPPQGDSPVLHCASLLRTIFASLARAHERVHVQNASDFPQAKLDMTFFCMSISNDFPCILHDVEEQLHHRYCIAPMDLLILD